MRFVVPRLIAVIAVQWPSTAPSRFMDVSFVVLANHHLSPVTGCSPSAAQLDPWCWTLPLTLDGVLEELHSGGWCILSRESFKQTVQPFKGTWCIPRWVSPGGTKKGNGSVFTQLSSQVLQLCLSR